MIDAQYACHPPALEYLIPLPPSPAACPMRCGVSQALKEIACCHEIAALSTAPAALGQDNRLRTSPGLSAIAGESVGVKGLGLSHAPITAPRAHTPTSEHAKLEKRKVSFEEFAVQHRQRQHAESQRRSLEQRIHAARVFTCLSARLLRVGATAQRGLVEAFKHGDKSGFATIYNTVNEIHESCHSAFRRNIHRQDPLEEIPPSSDPRGNRTPVFMHQLRTKTRNDLLEILGLVRTDPQFLFERISSLTSSQLSALTSSTAFVDSDPTFSVASRTRNQPLFSKRTPSQSILFKDHALAFERNDSLSVLLFNVFATPLDWNPAEAQLRLDIWSSTCAKLISRGDNNFYPFVGRILSYWSYCSEWKAKKKLELYLMDVLQKGAFLLENIENPVVHSLGAELPDPLRTDAAEEFFEFAIQGLFEVLDDPDAGLPAAVLEFGNAVLAKLVIPGSREHFLEYIFAQWFFSRFLQSALSFPETHGLLLDFHIGKDAREKLLGQIGLRAQSQIYRIFHSVPQFSKVHLKACQHVDNMLSRFTGMTCPESYNNSGRPIYSRTVPSTVILSAMDIVTLLNALFPKQPFSSYDSPSGSGCPTIPVNPKQPQHFHSHRSGRSFEAPYFPGKIDTLSGHSQGGRQPRTLFPQSSTLSRNADLIRFELSDIRESEEHPNLDHPSSEDWVAFSVSDDGASLVWSSSQTEDGTLQDTPFDYGSEEDQEALQKAIVKLAESETFNRSGFLCHPQSLHGLSLQQRFDAAKSSCEHRSDFLGAHYWWAATQQLDQYSTRSKLSPLDDTWILGSMLSTCTRSLSRANNVIRACEHNFITLNPIVEQMQLTLRDLMMSLAKLRNKMWYMTDVKNSMRYEDAKNVALALKIMVYPQSVLKQPTNECRSRNGTRSLAGSFLQKPEMQVMNVMKAPTSQGGPNKLSDEQVELTRKWLEHHGIENFCQGEERIHRFCYEVKSSINKLVGDTMMETPVLWASELFQEERAKYEGPSSRSFPGLSAAANIRPSSIASEDSIYSTQSLSFSLRASDSLFRPQHETPSLVRKSSFQSLSSDKWKTSRNHETTESSIWDSPGRTTSSSTVDSCSTFWSPPHTHTHSAASASSFQSRPPSMFGETSALRRSDRNVHGKAAFLDELRQTLTSLLLSDLGSPVWSCGSETDAWFTNFLNRKTIQEHMAKRARIQQFLAECDAASTYGGVRASAGKNPSHRRSQSADPVLSRRSSTESGANPGKAAIQDDTQRPTFAYQNAFRQLIDVFSHHANPFVKLNALRDLRALVIASLSLTGEHQSISQGHTASHKLGPIDIEGNHAIRSGFSEPWSSRFSDEESLPTPTSFSPGSIEFGSRQTYDLGASESQVIDAMKNLLRETQPKTLFRDLQFVSAFVPSEILNKTDSGTAFLHFGLAALALKDEVCDSMVEIADRIVFQELSRRHSHQPVGMIQRHGHAIEDAAGMWIITAKEGKPVAQRELAILYLTHPELLPKVTLPLTLPRDTFKAEMMYRRDKDSKSDPQSMCLALHWMQLAANGKDELAINRLREREEFDSIS